MTMELNVVTMKLPVNHIENAIRIAANSQKAIVTLDEEHRGKYPVQDKELIRNHAGEQGERKYEKDCEILEAQKKEIVRKAQENIENAHREAVAFLDEQFTPDGGDIIGENAGDVALFDHELISTPDQLNRILQKHDNIAFRVLAQRYAADPSRNWEGYNFFDKEESCRKYTEQVFENLSIAAAHPGQPLAIQYTATPGEYARLADAYGLHEEFAASTGSRLVTVINSLK